MTVSFIEWDSSVDMFEISTQWFNTQNGLEDGNFYNLCLLKQ